MISVLMWCYSKQDLLNQTLPNWLNQKGIDYEIILVHGPGIKINPNPLIHAIPCNDFHICKAYNLALSKASGDIIVITQCDMLLKTDLGLKLMFENYKPDRMVKAIDFPFLHICMVSKEAVIKAGGWYEPFGELYGYEDTDLVATLIEHGIKNFYIHGAEVLHLKHDKPELTDELRERYAKSRELFEARHE